MVDGKQVGGTYSTTAVHSQGQWQDLVLTGNFGTGNHTVDVNFINNGWDGSTGEGHDRNLYVGSLTLDGKTYQGNTATITGWTDPTIDPKAAVMLNDGTAEFHVNIAGTVATATAAQPTPTASLVHVTTSGTGAVGGSSPSDLTATAAGQTLVGNGGNDVFHIGEFTATRVSELGHGVSTVVESGSSYTLADGINNLTSTGSSSHTLTGNALNNWIVGSNAADVINGGAGNDTIVAGTGANKLTGGAGQDTFVFSSLADKGNHVTDFTSGQDLIDLRAMMKAIGYAGGDPVHDNVLHIMQSGTDTQVTIDPHHNGDSAAHTVVTLDHILPSAVKLGSDIVWH
jgi:Ca2+-binding RTX toxin-like protein